MKRLLCFFFCAWSTWAVAHKASDSYLTIAIDNERVTVRWDIAIRDLDYALALDSNDDGAITWGEVRSKSSELGRYALSRLQLRGGNHLCQHQQSDLKIDEHTDGSYVVLLFNSDCRASKLNHLVIDYQLFAGLDPQHRGLLRLNLHDKNFSAVLVPGQSPRSFSLSTNRASWTAALDFIQEGIWHIWTGYDHLLFLLSLLLPSVMVFKNTGWQPVSTFKPALWDVVKVTTAFTLAHSVTLSLAALDKIHLPSRWVESAIAASVVFAALNNLVPIFTGRRTLLAFSFGLIHGFGFANVLAGLGLTDAPRLLGLLGFNLGVEIGQLALIIIFLPVAYRLSGYRFYSTVILKSCSLGIAGLAALWFLERAFNISITL